MLINKFFHSIRKIHSQVRELGKTKLRSSKWHSVREEFLNENPNCAACGSHKNLQVHHIKPFHLHPELELDFKNLISLCMDKNECHLKIGHGDSFQFYNPNVKEDAKKFGHLSNEERLKLAESAKSNRLKD